MSGPVTPAAVGLDATCEPVATPAGELQVVRAGAGPPVVLLHGFPEGWYGWRRVIAPLAAAGLRVHAVEQRGYPLSAKPAAVAAYHLDRLVDDVRRVIAAADAGPVHLVGHDWGGVVAWATAAAHPQLCASLSVLNAPHPRAFRRHLRRSPAQWARSWYMGAFQLPWLPERAAAVDGHRRLAARLRADARPGAFTAEALRWYRRGWAHEGALGSMIDWYRAAGRYRPRLTDPQVTVPTQVLWGRDDRYLATDLAAASAAYCDDATVRLLDATHWVVHEEPAAVARSLEQHIAAVD